MGLHCPAAIEMNHGYMEEETPAAPTPSSSDNPSLTMSWATVGFLLGALCVLALPRPAPPATPSAAVPAPAGPPAIKATPGPPRIATIQAVFEAYGQDAVWDRDTTEVAIWDSETGDYSDCYEVLRMPQGFFFRSIPRLTRPALTHGVKPDAPLRFTESAKQREEWLGEKNEETWRVLQESIRSQSAQKPPP